MDKTTIVRSCSLLFLLLLVVSLPSIVQGYHVGVTWGSTYHNTAWDPDPYWWSTY
ncbi:MAG: hypothetical protein QXU99_06500 [Candidatus Bathyarchaeia archaeon]